MTFAESVSDDENVRKWLLHNGLDNLFVILKPEGKDIYRAYTVTEDHSEDAAAQFALDYKDIGDVPEAVLKHYYVAELPKHLTRDNERPQLDIHVIISIASGTRRSYQFFHLVLKEILTAIGLPVSSYKIHHTTSAQSVTEYTEKVIFPTANAGLRQTVILLSGDGGIFDIINVMLQKPHDAQYVKPVIGLLPLGTGNALANSSSINKDNSKGFLPFIKGQPHPVPVFAATFSPGSVFVVDEGRSDEEIFKNDEGNPVVYGGMVCSWGLHASLVADSDTEEYRKHGSQRFQMAAQALLYPEGEADPHKYKGKISTLRLNRAIGQLMMPLKPNPEENSEHMYVLATLVSNLEKTLVISPDSKPLEGQLRLLHWGPVTAEETMEILGKAFDGGKHTSDERVLYKDIEGLRIDMEEEEEKWRRICVDGKIVKVNKGGWVEVRTEYRRCIDLVA